MSPTSAASLATTGNKGDTGRTAAILPASQQTLHTIALTARIVLLPAALLAIIAAFTDRPLEGGLVEAGTVVGALAVATLAGFSLYSAQPRVDLGAVMFAMLLAGGEAIQGFGLIGEPYISTVYALPVVVWLALFGGAVALALTIPVGPAGSVRQLFDAPPFSAPAQTTADSHHSPGSRTAQSPSAAASQTPPGWYPSPDGSSARWWDGSAWTEHRRDLGEFGGQQAKSPGGERSA